MRTTDFYPDFQTRLYDRRAARWRGKYVHESVNVDGPVGQLSHELQHYSFRDLSDQFERINRYSTLAARELHESGKPGGASSNCWSTRSPRFSATTSCGAGFSTGSPG